MPINNFGPSVICTYTCTKVNRLNLPYFISARISQQAKGSFSSIISRVAVISIAVGVGSILLSFMILLGFQDKIKDKIYSFSGHLIISKYALTNAYEDRVLDLSDSLVLQLDNLPGIIHWQPNAYRAGLLKTPEEVQGVVVKGFSKRQDTVAFKRHLIEGRLPKLKEKGYTTEVVLSKKIARYLRLNVGEEVLIYFIQNPPRYRKLQIVGIYETGLEEFDENIIYGDMGMVRRINNWKAQQVGGIEVFIDDIAKIDQRLEDVFNAIGYDLYVEKVSDKYLQIFDWLSLLNRNVVIFLVLILFVAGFSMVSILLILIMERTQMVGVLKAMGASGKLLRDIFLANGLRLIIRGLGWGNLLAFGIGLAQYYGQIIPLDATSYYMDHVPIAFNWPAVIGVNLLVIILISGSLFIPLSVISRIQPIKSIRFD